MNVASPEVDEDVAWVDNKIKEFADIEAERANLEAELEKWESELETLIESDELVRLGGYLDEENGLMSLLSDVPENVNKIGEVNETLEKMCKTAEPIIRAYRRVERIRAVFEYYDRMTKLT
jgi:chaperonin cofactor prefoldin